MKGNINPFSGDKQYQTDFTLRFKLAKIEEAYTQDIYNRNQYNLIFLCIFSIFLLILSYFSNSCNISSPECTHQFLLILNMVTIFLTIILISRKKSIQPLIFLLNGLYPYMKIFEEFEGRVTFILISIHLTVLAFFLIYSWRKVVIFEVFGYFMIYFYLRFHDYYMTETLFKNFGFILLTIGVSVFLLFLNEKTNKEKWVLFDSFKKSERLLEFLIDEFNQPIFLIDSRKQIQLSNFQALNLLQQASGNPNPVSGVKKNFKGKGIAQNRSFQELFPQENSQNSMVANAVIASVLSGGKNYSCGLLKLNLFKSNPNQDNEPEIGQSSQLIAEEQLFELACQGFIWKGIKCALIGLKEERNFQIHSLFNDQMIGKSLDTLMELIFTHSMEERYYYDSLMQNTTLMEANKFLYSRLYNCHAHIFYTVLMNNFILNNFEKLSLEGEHFYQNFIPFELLGTITHILKKNTDKNDVVLEVVEFEKSLLKLEKNYSNFSGGIGESEKNSPFLRNPLKSNSEEMEKTIPVYGPCHTFQHIIITLLKSVMKIQLCKRFALSFRLEKPDNPLNQSNQDASNISFLQKTSSVEKKDEEDHVLRIDITFEEFSEPRKQLPNNNNMLVGDILSSTFKEQKKVKEYLEDIMKKDKSFIEADRDASFLYFQNKKSTSLGVFFLPYMIKALNASFKITHEEEYNKTSTRFILVSPVRLKKIEELNEKQGEKSMNKVLGYAEKKSAVFPNINQEKKIEESALVIKKPKVFTQIKKVFAFEFFNKSKDSQTKITEKKEESKEDWGDIKRSNSRDFREELLISNPNFTLDSIKNPQRLRPSPLETIESATNSNSNSNRISSVSPKRKSPLKNPPPPLTIKKNEIYIEEELKKYLYHMQNGFTATVEHILNEILNEESTKGAHIIFPPKNYLFQDKENHSRTFNSHEKNNIPMPKKSPNSLRGNIKRLPSDDKEDVSSFLFTESGRTESMLTGKSNDDELLLNVDSEPNSGENNSFPKENPHTRSNQLQPRTILRNEGNNGHRRGPIFRSPNLLRSKLEEKHVLVGGESLMKYLKTATFNSLTDSQKDMKPKEKKLDLDSLREKSNQKRMSFSRASDAYKQKETKDIRRLTYTRQWVVCKVKGENKIVTEINCAMFRQDPEPPSFDAFPKEAKKVFIRKPTKRPKSIVSDKDRISDTPDKRQKQKSVLNKIKNFTKLDNLQKFEEIKQEDESPKRKNIGKYIEILKNLTFKEKPTILAYDSESQINDPNRCKGIKSLALKVGHDYKFELCSNGVQIIKNYKSFILKSNIYHIIIIELEMFQLTGWKCVKKIRNFEAKYKPKHRSFIVGLLNDDERNYEVYVRWGFDEFLRKPFDSNLFEEILKRRIDEIKKGEELMRISIVNMNSINGEQKDPQIIASTPTSSEFDWFKEMVKPVAETGREAIYQKEPILMMAIDDNYFILMGISNLKLKVQIFVFYL